MIQKVIKTYTYDQLLIKINHRVKYKLFQSLCVKSAKTVHLQKIPSPGNKLEKLYTVNNLHAKEDFQFPVIDRG